MLTPYFGRGAKAYRPYGIFSYQVREDGSLFRNDMPDACCAQCRSCAMVITNGTGGNLAVTLSRCPNTSVQDTLLGNIVQTLQNKNYYGLDVDFEYISI